MIDHVDSRLAVSDTGADQCHGFFIMAEPLLVLFDHRDNRVVKLSIG